MTHEANNLSCAGFQALLPELIGRGEDVAAHPHILGCARCRALLADLETIAEAARQRPSARLLKTTPATASVHTKTSNVQPSRERIDTSMNGV